MRKAIAEFGSDGIGVFKIADRFIANLAKLDSIVRVFQSAQQHFGPLYLLGCFGNLADG